MQKHRRLEDVRWAEGNTLALGETVHSLSVVFDRDELHQRAFHTLTEELLRHTLAWHTRKGPTDKDVPDFARNVVHRAVRSLMITGHFYYARQNAAARPSAGAFIGMLMCDSGERDQQGDGPAAVCNTDAQAGQPSAIQRSSSVGAVTKLTNVFRKMRLSSASSTAYATGSQEPPTSSQSAPQFEALVLANRPRADGHGQGARAGADAKTQHVDLYSELLGTHAAKDAAVAEKDDGEAAVRDGRHRNCNIELVIHEQADTDVAKWMQPLRVQPARGRRWSISKRLQSSWSAVKWGDVLAKDADRAPQCAQSLIARTHCIDRSGESNLGLHIFADRLHDSVMVLKVEPGGACANASPDAPKCGDVIVGINGKYVAGLGLDAVLNEIAAADAKLVLNVSSPKQVLATRGH